MTHEICWLFTVVLPNNKIEKVTISKIIIPFGWQWLIQEEEIRRIMVWSQSRQIVCETLSWKNSSQKKELVQWLKVKALSSNPSTVKQNKKQTKIIISKWNYKFIRLSSNMGGKEGGKNSWKINYNSITTPGILRICKCIVALVIMRIG
jgi:hypothetical protein